MEFITNSAEKTKELGRMLAEEVLVEMGKKERKGAQVICLEGELGAGKTTFTQGFLEGLGAPGPYTSPTFMIMKQYRVTWNTERGAEKLREVYHIDAYRVESEDVLELGWEEIAEDKNNIIIVEWSDRIREIIPDTAVKLRFSWIDEDRRKIVASRET